MDQREVRAGQLAGVNGGAISRAQLTRLGFSREAIRGRVRRGVLHELGGDVFAWGHPFLPAKGWNHAALLSMGPTSALSYETAGFLLRMIDDAPREIHLTIPRGQDRTPCRGVHVHSARDLRPGDLLSRDGLRMTTPARILLDCAPSIDDTELRHMAEVAVVRHRVSPLHLAIRARASSPAPGTARLRRMAESLTGSALHRSKLERRFRARWERAGHPAYLPNAMVEGIEVDGLFPDRRLILEMDIYEWHGAESRYRNDRRRARSLGVADWDLIRVAGEDFDVDPDGVVADVARIVALHPPRLARI